MNPHNRKLQKMRSSTGQLETFAAEIVIGTLVVIGFVFFMLDAGVSGFYKQKVGFISSQAAQFAANYSGKKVQPATEQFVKELCAQMGLNVTSLVVQASVSKMNGTPVASCQVSGVFPLLTFEGNCLPASVNITDAAIAVSAPGASGQSGSLTIVGNGNSVFDQNGLLPTGTITGNGNTFVGATTVGNTTGNGNANTTGNTTGNGNSGTSGSTTGNGNSGTSGSTTGNGNANTSGTTTGNGNANTSGTTTGNGISGL